MNKSRARIGVIAAAAIAATATSVFVLSSQSAEAAEWPLVRSGDQGASVLTVQHLLRDAGSDVEADGDFDPGTADAVRAFQESNDLGGDGVVGDETWPELVVELTEGDSGAAVQALQVQLNRLGYDVPDDGEFVSSTVDALIEFKTDKELSADAETDADTWLALMTAGATFDGEYTLPLNRDAVSRDDWGKTHHDYPASDLPVPTGTVAYAMVTGEAIVFTDDGCGNGVRIDTADGAQFTYCHFDSHSIPSGPVNVGDQIGLTGSTGNSTGPHLHLQIRTGDGALRCPQPLNLALYDGAAPPNHNDLPTSGCSH